MDRAQAELTAILRARHGLTGSQADDFTIQNQTQIVEMVQQTSQTFTVLLGSIAAISLVVGGIGIMNIMLVSVTERTREIGIRKAVGAKRRDILAQFLVEAIVLGLVGGVVGRPGRLRWRAGGHPAAGGHTRRGHPAERGHGAGRVHRRGPLLRHLSGQPGARSAPHRGAAVRIAAVIASRLLLAWQSPRSPCRDCFASANRWRELRNDGIGYNRW